MRCWTQKSCDKPSTQLLEAEENDGILMEEMAEQMLVSKFGACGNDTNHVLEKRSTAANELELIVMMHETKVMTDDRYHLLVILNHYHITITEWSTLIENL